MQIQALTSVSLCTLVQIGAFLLILGLFCQGGKFLPHGSFLAIFGLPDHFDDVLYIYYMLLRPDNDGGQGAQVGWVALVWTRRARVGHYDSVRDHYSIGDRASGLWGDLGGLGGRGVEEISH